MNSTTRTARRQFVAQGAAALAAIALMYGAAWLLLKSLMSKSKA